MSNSDDRLITVAIHTYEKAVALKSLLESEGIHAALHNVNLSNPVVSSGVRVRIGESDLPKALRIIENTEIFAPKPNDVAQTHTPRILVPVDFSDYSMKAAKMAFDIASRHKVPITFLHSYINPAISKPIQLTDSFSFEIKESQEVDKKLRRDASELMDKFENDLRQQIKSASLPPVKFDTIICEGVPEDVINNAAKDLNPSLIVMGTRGSSRKEEELIGSVTAELLDSCRYPVFTIPESINLDSLTDISNILFFCNLEQEDMLAMDQLSRIFNNIPVDVTIAHVPGKKDRSASKAMEALTKYCDEHYPSFSFSVERIRPGSALDDFKRINKTKPINLIVLPNKKRNVFFRFFNPSLAHKLLLHADIPMLVIPV